jgi:hexosaminidase
MKKPLFFAVFALVIATVTFSQQVAIIPAPVKLEKAKGQFILSKETVITASNDEDRRAARLFNEYLRTVFGFTLDIDRQESKNYIRLVTRQFIQAPSKDAYTLKVGKDGVVIEGDTYAGTFYGLQTLMQLLPVTNLPAARSLSIPFVTIEDYPRFSYRGMHLDVSRHFFPVSFVKRYIDYLSYHKLNYFHWHLTDDQGWRIEIKKYPNLTNTGAWRNGTIVGRYPGSGNDNIRYGGYYTQDEVREVVKYAAERHITVVPEIEMPGHASSAIAAYPFLSCFPEKETVIPSHPSKASIQMKGKKVQETWGVFEDVFCAGNDTTFSFLQDVLVEVLELFPSRYIHVGGDECPKSNWKKCPKCQARIKTEGLKDEHELQSYFIQRMEKFLNAKGRVLIGWDEILEGGLAPNAVVMSWRGESGGIEAAKQKHQVIMTPQKPVYFDHTQTRNEDSVGIGGYNPLEAVYGYEPVPSQLDSASARYILGAQANLWTEYIKYPSKVEYMLFPRLSALSEVLWSPKAARSWTDFEQRLQSQFRRYELWNANYSKAYYEVKVNIIPAAKNEGLLVVAEPRDRKGELHYSIASGSAVRYTKPVRLQQSTDMRIDYSRTGKLVNSVPLKFSFNKATGKKVSITKTPNEKYPGQGGAFSLVNGVWSNKGLSHPDWLGFIGDDIVATIDLGKSHQISTVKMHTIDQNGSWVYLPAYVEVMVSLDGKTFTSVGKSSEFTKDTLTMGWITVKFQQKNARYVKVVAKNYGMIPEGRAGAGNKAWVFADEIQVQ